MSASLVTIVRAEGRHGAVTVGNSAKRSASVDPSELTVADRMALIGLLQAAQEAKEAPPRR
jgi:hypothetical protein